MGFEKSGLITKQQHSYPTDVRMRSGKQKKLPHGTTWTRGLPDLLKVFFWCCTCQCRILWCLMQRWWLETPTRSRWLTVTLLQVVQAGLSSFQFSSSWYYIRYLYYFPPWLQQNYLMISGIYFSYGGSLTPTRTKQKNGIKQRISEGFLPIVMQFAVKIFFFWFDGYYNNSFAISTPLSKGAKVTDKGKNDW